MRLRAVRSRPHRDRYAIRPCYAASMSQTVINLPAELSERLKDERRRRDVSTDVIIVEALHAYLAFGQKPRVIPFAKLGRSSDVDTSEWVDEILAEG